MSHREYRVNGASSDTNDLSDLEEATAKLAEVRRAVLDGRLTRTHVQMLVLISERRLTFFSWREFSEQLVRRVIPPIPKKKDRPVVPPRQVSQHHVETMLSDLKSLGYIRKEKRPVPEAGNQKLTTYQLAILAAKIDAARSAQVVDFSGRARIFRTGSEKSSAPAQRIGRNPPDRHGMSAPARSRRGSPLGNPLGAREHAPRPSLADALIAAGQLVRDALCAWSPSPDFDLELRRRYPGCSPEVAVAEIMGDVLKVPQRQSVDSVLSRIHARCRAQSGRASSRRSGNSPSAQCAVATGIVCFLDRRFITTVESDADHVMSLIDAAVTDDEKLTIFERERQRLRNDGRIVSSAEVV